jgi:hypothetical protein
VIRPEGNKPFWIPGVSERIILKMGHHEIQQKA